MKRINIELDKIISFSFSSWISARVFITTLLSPKEAIGTSRAAIESNEISSPNNGTSSCLAINEITIRELASLIILSSKI